MASPAKQKVVIVGAGPVGCLAALYAAARGDDVELYELRGDLRVPGTVPLNFTRSINLSLSHRGITAMEGCNRTDAIKKILQDVVPIYGRMIHGKDNGELWEEPQAYDVHGRNNFSADRGMLSNVFLDELEQAPNIKLFFDHKLTGADFQANKAWFERRLPNEPPAPGSSGRVPEIEVNFDFLIGADGAHSASRYHMMKFARVDYEQEYIDTLWCEFRISPSPITADFLISPSHLHIWPGKEFMFIALPSTDKSFTCTLFAPAIHYEKLERSKDDLLEFFDVHFPGVCPELISPTDLIDQFTENPHLPLISLKCKPHHYDSSVVIVGDAAHAVLPFYGQGLNAGLEDIQVLFNCLDRHGVYSDSNHTPSSRAMARQAAFADYTNTRTADTHAINDLSRQNYVEMRWTVKQPLYRLRKAIEEALYHYVPSLGWQTQYTRVSFTNQRYSEIIDLNRRQGRILGAVFGSTVVSVLAVAGIFFWKKPVRVESLGTLRGFARDVLSKIIG
ncbi:hypothetical protein BJX99DRAFT_162468 [Aspergillus californicus]